MRKYYELTAIETNEIGIIKYPSHFFASIHDLIKDLAESWWFNPNKDILREIDDFVHHRTDKIVCTIRYGKMHFFINVAERA